MTTPNPPGLRKWLEQALEGQPPSQLKQAQVELKSILKALTEEKLISKLKWESQTPHVIGDIAGTVKRLREAAGPRKTPPKEQPPIQQEQAPAAAQYYIPSPQRQAYHPQQPAVFAQPPPSYAPAAPQNQFVVYNVNAHVHPQSQPAPHQVFHHPPPQPRHPQYDSGFQGYPPPQQAPQPQAVHQEQPRQSRFNDGGYGQQQPSAEPVGWRWGDIPQTQTSNGVGHSAWGPPPLPAGGFNYPPPSIPTVLLIQPVNGGRDHGKFSRDEVSPKNQGSNGVPISYLEEIPSKSSKSTEGSRAKLERMSERLHAFLADRKGNMIRKVDLAEFYDAYPRYRKLLNVQTLEEMAALPGSQLRLTKHEISLASSKRKKVKVEEAEEEEEESPLDKKAVAKAARAARFGTAVSGNESPSKKAARAARFGNDFKLESGTSTYEKITKDSQRVAAALEMAEKMGTEVDWSSLVIKGTCTAWEKGFLRLTAPPDPSTVRPEPVLKIAMENIRKRLEESGKAAYSWASDQLKSIRQDLRVQHLENTFTVEVYEWHARAALKYGQPDFQEFNQCCTRVHELYDGGLGSDVSKAEFAAYLLLYHVYCKARYSSPSSDVMLSLCRPKSTRALSDGEAHALAVHVAVIAEDWPRFLRLFDSAPNLGKDLLRPMLGYVRLLAVRACCQASKSVPSSFLSRSLQFEKEEEVDEFCARFKLQLSADRSTVESKTTLQFVNETLGEGTLWT